MNIRHKLVSISLFALFSAHAATAKEATIENVKYDLSEEKKTAVIADAKNMAIEAVEIPESIQYENESYTITGIGDHAFYKNAVITEVKLPNSITSLGKYAFGSCTQLKSVTIPASVETLEEGAFYACANIESIQFEKRRNSISIKDYTFHKCEKLTSIQFCEISDTIGAYAFSNCSLLADDMDLSSVSYIGEKSFYNCKSISKLTLGEHCDLGSYAFYNCKAITDLRIINPNNIGDHCFMYCEALDSVVIEYTHPYKLGEIGDSCFIRCTNLNTMKFLDYSRYKDTVYHPELSSGICGIGTDVFDHAPLQQGIFVSKDEIEEYKEAKDWMNYANHLVAIEIRNANGISGSTTTNPDTIPTVIVGDTVPSPISDTIPAIGTDSIPAVVIDTVPSPITDTIPAIGTDTIPAVVIDTVPSPITDTVQMTASLQGLRIIVFGDSKAEGVGNEVPRTQPKQYKPWGYYMQEEHGCVVTNVAVGGSHMTPAALTPQNSQNGLGTYSLVQAWKTGDYSLVDASIEWAHNSSYGSRWDHVAETIKSTTAKDYDIVCIEAGTNDWNNPLRVIGNWEDTKPIYNYTVALRNTIEALYEMNPDLYILIIPPVVRQMDVNDKSTYSDYYLNPKSGLYLYDVSMAMMDIAKKCGADAIDAYYGMGFTYENWTSKYSGDGTHPNENGYKVMAEKISEHILKNYFKENSPEESEPLEEEPTDTPAEQAQTTSVLDYINGGDTIIPNSTYDLNGRLIKGSSENLRDGYYIINGQKYYIKNSRK